MLDPHDLYGLPFERFIAERNELARQLRAEGRRDDAERVAAMRKPSLAAWAVNQLVRTQRRAVTALFDAGDALATAQSDLLAGRGEARALREAGRRERASLAKLVQAARGLLSSEGHELSPSILERVSETLHAAALDKGARAQIEQGCLHRELRHAGLGTDDDISPRTSRGSRAREPRAPRKAAGRDSRGPAGQARRERSERLKAARSAEADARRRAERADRALKSAQQRREQAAGALAKAEAALRDAGARAEKAAAAHQRARQAREQL